MHILVTNDDGIQSEGIWGLARGLRDLGQVTVVAPDRDQSGVGPAMTLQNVVRAGQVASPVEGVQAFSVQGTPADCVILATESLSTELFDLVVSGINRGSNLGLDVLTSGTVGAALHGFFRGIPSLALSVSSLTDVHYEAAARTAVVLARCLAENTLPGTPLLNVNLPNVDPSGIKGVEITRLGPRAYHETVARGHDGRRSHYWIRHNRPITSLLAQGTDVWAVKSNAVSITPVDLVFTGGEEPPALRGMIEEVAEVLGLSQD